MKRAFRLVVLLLLVGGWALAAAAVHVVRAPGDLPYVGHIAVLPKEQLSFRQIYVDTTAWTAQDLAARADFAAHLQQVQRADLIQHVMAKQGGCCEINVVETDCCEMETSVSAPATQPAAGPVVQR